MPPSFFINLSLSQILLVIHIRPNLLFFLLLFFFISFLFLFLVLLFPGFAAGSCWLLL